MDGIKEIKIFNNFVYDTPENRDKVMKNISELFLQSNLFQSSESKNQIFWNTVEEMKVDMYNIMESLNKTKSQIELDKISTNIITQKVNRNIEKKNKNINLDDNNKSNRNRPESLKEKSIINKNPNTRHGLINNSFNLPINTKVNKSVDITYRKEIFPKEKVEINLNIKSNEKSSTKNLKKVDENKIINPKIIKAKQENIPKIISKAIYNSNNSKNLKVNRKSPSKNNSKEHKIIPITKENKKKASIDPLENKQKSKLKSIEINLNLEEEIMKHNPFVDEEIMRENLQKNENCDVCLILEELQIPSGYPIDSQGNQLIEIIEEKNKIGNDLN